MSDLTVGQMQMVEIARALSADARILIMDEPTASLSANESEKLFEVIRKLRADGVCIIYISHRMEEVQLLADRVTVLRDGRFAGDLAKAEATLGQDRRLDGRPRAVGRLLPRAEGSRRRVTWSSR